MDIRIKLSDTLSENLSLPGQEFCNSLQSATEVVQPESLQAA